MEANDAFKHDGNADGANQHHSRDDSSLFLSSIINSLQDPVVSASLDGIITSWNPAAELLYGYPAAEAIGKPLSMIFLPVEFTGMVSNFEKIRNGEQVELYEALSLHKQGREIIIELRLSPVRNNIGDIIGVSIIARDVTELRRIKEEEKKNLQVTKRLRTILETITDFAIITLDKDGYITDWNSGAVRMLGFTKEEAVGQYGDIFFTDEDRHAGIPEQEFIRARETGRATDERWHRRKNGSRFFMSGVMVPIYHNEISGFVKVARDITDRKLAEEALFLTEQRKSLAVQTAQMGEWDWNITRNIVHPSEQTCRLLGIDCVEKIKASSFISAIHEEDIKLVKDQLKTALAGLNVFQAEFRIIRADNGQVKWMNAYGRVILQQRNGPGRMIGVIYDITGRKMMEKEKDDFINVASHELKTPVTSIKGYSDVLQEIFTDSNQPENASMVKKLNAQVDRLVKLIYTLLDSTTVAGGKMKIHPKLFDLNELIEEQVQEFRLVSPDHQFLWQPFPVPAVHADRERIRQVLTNFISNAVKYSHSNTAINISAQDTRDGVTVRVRDAGMGIAPEDQSHLFQRYYRARNEQITNYPGLGLGLYISSEIIKQHHGTIGVESMPGQGATFFFTLPYS